MAQERFQIAQYLLLWSFVGSWLMSALCLHISGELQLVLMQRRGLSMARHGPKSVDEHTLVFLGFVSIILTRTGCDLDILWRETETQIAFA